jgi:hypothetical protein
MLANFTIKTKKLDDLNFDDFTNNEPETRLSRLASPLSITEFIQFKHKSI